MSILSTLKSLLGVDDDRGRSADAGTPVSVEREPEAESERAVKGVDAPPVGGDAAEAPPTGESEPASGGEEGETGGSPTRDPEPAPDGEPVDAIKGIGAAYADRLGAAGVHTIEELAAADAAALAEATDIGEGRLDSWIEVARARTR